MGKPDIRIGLAWYHEDDYERLLQLFVDRDRLHQSHKQWLEAATHGLEELQSQGYIVEKVYITPDEFTAWCSSKGMPPNAKARTSYVNEIVGRMFMRSGNGDIN